ncbi:Group-specific protein [Bacillus wiedmannii]|nr:Group-specific protein [Bacillus wiedmannii]
MKFVYVLQIIIFLIPYYFGASFTHINIFYLIILGILVFIIHEYLHVIVINKMGDISLTCSGIFFWLNTNAILSKTRFWIFMSLPIIVLSVIPGIISSFVSGNFKSILLFVCWINAIISASDIYNSLLIAIKPKQSIFCRGYYKVKKN